MNNLELKLAEIDTEYKKKWNINQSNFLHLYKNGEKINNILYRVGMFGAKIEDGHILVEDYFMLVKHIEAYYKDSITNDKSQKPHHLEYTTFYQIFFCYSTIIVKQKVFSIITNSII